MKKLVIAVDCDDVLVKTTPFFVAAYNELYETNIQLHEAHTVNDIVWGVDHESVIKRLAELTQTDAYKALGPSEDEVKVLKKLGNRHSLHLVTARQDHERELTQAMLERDLPGVFAEMDFVGWQGSKGEVCKRIGADILIDDSIRHLHNALEHGLAPGSAILFGDYPWNNETQESLEGIRQCRDWNEVMEVIDGIARK